MPDLFLKDWGWKIFSLLLAVAIWLTVHNILNASSIAVPSTGNDKVTFDSLLVVPVSEKADVHDYQVTPRTVAVTVTGPHEVMATLQQNQIRAVVDLTGFQPPVDLTRLVDVWTPPKVTILKIEPQKVMVIPPAQKK